MSHERIKKLYRLILEDPVKAKAYQKELDDSGYISDSDEMEEELMEIFREDDMTDQKVRNFFICIEEDCGPPPDADTVNELTFLEPIFANQRISDEMIREIFAKKWIVSNLIENPDLENNFEFKCLTMISLVFRYRPTLVENPEAPTLFRTASIFKSLKFLPPNEGEEFLMRQEFHLNRHDYYWWLWFLAKQNYQRTGQFMSARLVELLQEPHRYADMNFPSNEALICYLLQDPDTSDAVTNRFIVSLFCPEQGIEYVENVSVPFTSVASGFDYSDYAHGFLEKGGKYENSTFSILMILLRQKKLGQAIELLEMCRPFNRKVLNEPISDTEPKRLTTYVLSEYGKAETTVSEKESYRQFLWQLFQHPCDLEEKEQEALEEILTQPLIDVVFPEGWREDPNFDPNVRLMDGNFLINHLRSYPNLEFAMRLSTHPEFSASKSELYLSHYIREDKTLTAAEKNFVVRMLQCGYVCSAYQVKVLTAKGIDVYRMTQTAVSEQRNKLATCLKSNRQLQKRAVQEDHRYQLLMERLETSEATQAKLLRMNQLLFEQLQKMSLGWEQAHTVLKQKGIELPPPMAMITDQELAEETVLRPGL